MEEVVIEPFTAAHLDGAARLSLAQRWVQTRDDWESVMRLGRGVVATAGGEVVATAFAIGYGPVATLGMIIVDEAMRGRGLGRAVTERAMAAARPRQWRLVATPEGLPLYRALGFAQAGEIARHQGRMAKLAAPGGVEWAAPADIAAIAALDARATGMERGALIRALMHAGRLAVIRGGSGDASGYAALRPFGAGEVAGPVVAAGPEEARRLLSFLLSQRKGAFVRLDTHAGNALCPWLESVGLLRDGGGVFMMRGEAIAVGRDVFALASQALG